MNKPTHHGRRHATLRRLGYRHRRTLAALCTFVAVLAALHVLAPPRIEGVAVLTAASDLPAGTVLAATHLRPSSLPPDAVPADAARTPADLVGQTLTGPVSARSVLTASTVATGQRLARPGHVVIALPLTDAALAPLVRPGASLDLFDAAGKRVAQGVRVIASPDAAGSGPGSLGGSSRAALIEVPPEVATTVATAGSGGLTIAVS